MEDLLQVGVITTTHGVRGEVKVFPTTDDPARFKKLKNVVLDTGKELVDLEVAGVKFFKNMVILKFKEYNNINDIECYKGKDIFKYTREEEKAFRKTVQMIFQNPYSSLNPRMTVKDIVGEGLKQHGMSTKDADAKVEQLLATVGLNKDHMSRFPHEFSGGQRQRIGIARALAVDPKFIVCDEPVSGLDVSIQAQVVNMFEDLQKERGLSYLFIAHDLLVVQHISDRIAVMYLGHMMELADADELMDNPIHPYTQSLLSAVPIPDPETARHSKRIVLEGDVPSPLRMPSGCPFRSRCKYATEQCAAARPELTDRGNGHMVACFNR